MFRNKTKVAPDDLSLRDRIVNFCRDGFTKTNFKKWLTDTKINPRESSGITCLHEAIRYGRYKLVKYLLKNGADPNSSDFFFYREETPLLLAIESNSKQKIPCTKMGRLLIRYGARVDYRDISGDTPLHYACKCMSLEYADLFLSYGVDINVKDNTLQTPLHMFVFSCWLKKDIIREELLYGLLSAGADYRLRNRYGETPLEMLEKLHKLPSGTWAEFLETRRYV